MFEVEACDEGALPAKNGKAIKVNECYIELNYSTHMP